MFCLHVNTLGHFRVDEVKPAAGSTAPSKATFKFKQGGCLVSSLYLPSECVCECVSVCVKWFLFSWEFFVPPLYRAVIFLLKRNADSSLYAKRSSQQGDRGTRRHNYRVLLGALALCLSHHRYLSLHLTLVLCLSFDFFFFCPRLVDVKLIRR